MSRLENGYMAKLAEQAERWDDMSEFMKRVARISIEGGEQFTEEDRASLSSAYKNAVASRRQARMEILKLEKDKSTSVHNIPIYRGYRARIEQELRDKIEDVLNILQGEGGGLIGAAADYRIQVFLYKMVGDYYRYFVEFLIDPATNAFTDEGREKAQMALNAYSTATQVAADSLAPSDTTRLGLALNFSVFYYEHLKNPAEACRLARDAYEKAFTEAQQSQDANVRQIMQLMKENLDYWAAGQSAEEKPPEMDGTACEDL